MLTQLDLSEPRYRQHRRSVGSTGPRIRIAVDVPYEPAGNVPVVMGWIGLLVVTPAWCSLLAYGALRLVSAALEGR